MKNFPLLAGLSIVAVFPVDPARAIDAVQVGSGFSNPIFVTAPAGDASRLFVVQQGGAIRILNLASGTVNATPFLTVTGISTGGERGLLGMAFHPDYATNGKFYVNVTNSSGNTEIREYTVSANPNVANSAGNVILTFTQPFSNHNGGWLGFGPNDGFLYIASGDGGDGNDPFNNAQNLNSLLGKMLRIDVNSDAFPTNSNKDYAIPPGNPFILGGGAPEVWSYGLRNPYRASFDRLTGDLYIGDVGQSSREEIDFQSAGSDGGENYGWRAREGTIDNPGVGDPAPPGAIDPIYDYSRGSGIFQGETVIGGYVYRGELMPEFQGTYFFGDYFDGKVWSFNYDGTSRTNLTSWTADLGSPFGSFAAVTSFGEGGTGELYVTGFNGNIYQIIPEPAVGGLIGFGVCALALRALKRKPKARKVNTSARWDPRVRPRRQCRLPH